MTTADLSFINRPLDIIQEVIEQSNDCNQIVKNVQAKFLEQYLTSENISLVPGIASASQTSLVRVSAMIHQDSLDDEYYQPLMQVNAASVNTGLWTRIPHDPKGLLNEAAFEEPDYSNLQCRKRVLAQCLESKKRFIIALYNGHETEEEWEKWRQASLRMNSLHELIGIYEECEIEAEEGDEPSLPVLHLIHRNEHKPLAVVSVEDMAAVRVKLMTVLTEVFGGSEQAAEALLMCLCSRPAMRVNGLVDSLFIGKMSLNICVEGENAAVAADNISHLLKQLKPFVAGPVKISNDPEAEATKNFAAGPIYPRFDPLTGILSQSILQQPDGCVLVVDETAIITGEFKDQAVCNLQSLIDLIGHQQVTYDFGMQQVSIKTDMPVVLVSKGSSVLPSDFKVSCSEIRDIHLSAEDAELFRSAIEYCRNLNCQIDEKMATFLEQDYVALRKASPLLPNGNPKMNEQELHRLVNLARLRSITFGQSNLTSQVWEEVKARYI